MESAPKMSPITPAMAQPASSATEGAGSSPFNMQQMRAHAVEAVSLLKLLGNEDRLLLLCQMAECERTVSELQELTGIEQPTLSQQLGVLRREGVVDTRREGKFIWYRLSDARALDLMQHIHRLFCA